MIQGARRLDVDLTRVDFEIWLACMVALEARFGSRAFVTDDPLNAKPMQKIADLIGEAGRIYTALPVLPQRG